MRVNQSLRKLLSSSFYNHLSNFSSTNVMIYLFSYTQYMLYIFLIIPAYFYLRVSSIFTLWFVFLKYLNTSSITGNP